jgi:hypothetical protein
MQTIAKTHEVTIEFRGHRYTAQCLATSIPEAYWDARLQLRDCVIGAACEVTGVRRVSTGDTIFDQTISDFTLAATEGKL